eukprot:COSAG01_NODE_1428_length_10331_cov_68.357995_4_plen_105_part_00
MPASIGNGATASTAARYRRVLDGTPVAVTVAATAAMPAAGAGIETSKLSELSELLSACSWLLPESPTAGLRDISNRSPILWSTARSRARQRSYDGNIHNAAVST